MSETLRSLFQRLRPSGWFGKGVWTIADQALFAGSNFLVNVLLARWLVPEAYGAYTVAYTFFVLLGTVQAGVLLEPMLVFGPSRFDGRLRSYLRLLLSVHGKIGLVGGVLLGLGAAAAWAWGATVLALALGALALAQVLILFQWLMRAACYIRTQPQLAVAAGVIYAVLLLGSAAALNAVGALTVASAIGAMAGASLVSALFTAWRLRIPAMRNDDGDLRAEAFAKHREYGGWAVGSGGLEWFNGYLPFLLLPLWAGLAETGGLRAVYNLVLPAIHVFGALGHLILPTLVRARETGTDAALAQRLALWLGAGCVLYGVAIGLGGPALLALLYEGKYDAYSGILWVAAFVPLALLGPHLVQALLRAREQPREVFKARVAGASVGSTVGAAAIATLGVLGALLCEIAVAVTETAWMIREAMRPSPTPPSGGGERKRVLMLAFACGPGRGSEPGQGWEFASRMAEHHDVTVLTYSGFGEALRRELAARPVPGLRVHTYRLPFERARHHRHGEDRTGLAEQIHYSLWQIGAARTARRLHRETGFDLTHHVSLMRYWTPSAVALRGVPFVWGPVGGGETAPAPVQDDFSLTGRREESLRHTAHRVAHLDPLTRRTARRATVALATTHESAERMRALGAPDVRLARRAVALAPETIAQLAAMPPPPDDEPFRFASIGRLLHWKGYDLGLRAFALARDADPRLADARYWIFGDGPEGADLKRLARTLGIADRVRFWGRVPRDECLELLGRTHVVVHPSSHDSGGYATLEGMAAGRPVLCLDLGGPARQVDEAVGLAVPAHTPCQIVRDMAAAMVRLATEPDHLAATGAQARRRVTEHYLWPLLIADVLEHYAEALGDPVARADDPAARSMLPHELTRTLEVA